MLKRGRKEGDRQDIGEGNHVKWDEVTIAEHDKERGTRQKIEEPPTPYHYGSDDEGDLESEVKSVVTNKIEQSESSSRDVVLDNLEMLRAKLQYEQARQQQAEEESSMSISSSPDASLHGEATSVLKEGEPTNGQAYYRADINDMGASGFASSASAASERGDGHVFDTVTYGFDHEPKQADSNFKHKRNAHYN